MTARSFPRRPPRAPVEPGRFNLFPYRQVAARRMRRRLMLELALAAVVGSGAALGSERIDRHRAAATAARHLREVGAMRAQLARLEPRLARAEQFESLRMRDARVAVLKARRRRIAALLESVGRMSPTHPGVSLRAMDIDPTQLTLDGMAVDLQMFSRWLTALNAQGAVGAPVIDVLERDGAHLRFVVRAELEVEDQPAATS